MTYQLVTANRLHDGEVVYLMADGGWSAGEIVRFGTIRL